MRRSLATALESWSAGSFCAVLLFKSVLYQSIVQGEMAPMGPRKKKEIGEERVAVNEPKKYVLISLVVLSVLLTSCGSSGTTGQTGGTGGTGNAGYDTSFPMPDSVINFTSTGSDSINFQTKLSLEDAQAFYREAFTKTGLTERTINTAVTETTFSMVFDGDASGRALVVQGVDLGDGTTNINVRYEDV